MQIKQIQQHFGGGYMKQEIPNPDFVHIAIPNQKMSWFFLCTSTLKLIV